MQMILALLLASEALAFGGKNGTASPTPTATPSPTSSPTETMICPGVTFEPDSTYTAQEKIKLWKAEEYVNGLIKSECFHEYFTTTKYRSQLLRTNGRTREQVVAHVREACIKVPLTMYYKNNNVVGYTYPNTNRVWTNRKIHSGYSACSVASNLGHETLHKLGYGHVSASDKYSVPYSWNAMAVKCCKELYE